MRLDSSVLDLDCEAEVRKICERMTHIVGRTLRRRGAVVALSGGVDSSVAAALSVRALGASRVKILLLPERESSEASLRLGHAVCDRLGVTPEVQNITAVLEALGAYQVRDEAIRSILPGYGPGWRSKIVIGGGLAGGINYHKLVAAAPDGQPQSVRLPVDVYLAIVAAQNYKQRIRKTVEYHHADKLNYAVVGTPNRLEYDQGFFVKNGDGSADVKPIAHLYKSQVYALARHLGLPEAVCSSRPTTDTYSLPQGQDEFFFALPYEQMDLALWAMNHGVPEEAVAQALNISPEQAALVYRDITAKRTTTRGLHAGAVLIEPVPEIKPAGEH